jgi:hypothetical protein
VNWHEIDWRFSSTKRIFQALSDGLKDVERDFSEAQEEFEIDDALEHTESLLGIAFVMAQTYIAGTASDASKLMGSGSKLTKEQLLKACGDRLAGSTVTRMELCDAIANYFKHHDEWNSWSATGRHQKTVSILRAAGIEENDDFPCRKAADILWSNNDGSDLEPLLSLISSWRKSVIADALSRAAEP